MATETTAPEEIPQKATPKIYRPGSLRGESTISLETLQAQLLFNGRKKTDENEEILGLRGFGMLLTPIWMRMGGQDPDPYAIWWMVKVEEAFAKRFPEIDEMIEGIEDLSAQTTNRRFEESHSVEPLELPLRFSTPQAHQGAELLARFDRLVRLALAGHHYGVINDQQLRQYVHKGGRCVRSVFESAKDFKQLGITKEDLEQGNAKALRAVEEMGVLPQDILSGDRKPEYTPNPVKLTGSFYSLNSRLLETKPESTAGSSDSGTAGGS